MTIEREGRALKTMAPVFDMFNHDPLSSTVHGFQESNQVRRPTHSVPAKGVREGVLWSFCSSGHAPRRASTVSILILSWLCSPTRPLAHA